MAKKKQQPPQHPEDAIKYQEILESTRDADGVENKDEARKLLVAWLLTRTERISEYAESRAREVADGFDHTHQPETDNGQMALDIDTYLVIGDSERIRVDRAMSQHTQRWLDVQARNHARQAAAWSAKDMHGRKLLAIQDERNCTMWEAEQILRGDA